MRVWRIENDAGEGPYCATAGPVSNAEGYRITHAHADSGHPSPWDDGMDEFRRHQHVCGLPTLCSVREWFAGWFDPMHSQGFRLSVYDVPGEAVLVGGRQVAFDRDKAKRVKSFSLAPLCK